MTADSFIPLPHMGVQGEVDGVGEVMLPGQGGEPHHLVRTGDVRLLV